MSRTFKAVVEGELLRPLERLGLENQQEVLITIKELPKTNGEQPTETGYERAVRLGAIGVIEGPPDLSTNPRYLEGFGSS